MAMAFSLSSENSTLMISQKVRQREFVILSECEESRFFN